MHTLIKIGLGLAIAIVFPFMIGFGIEAFYSSPKIPYELCRQYDPNNVLPAIDKTNPQQTTPISRDPQNDPNYKKCYDDAQSALDIYNRNVFLITTAFGFLAILVGTLLFSEKIGPVGPGLVFGGLFTILYGTARTFRSVDKQWIFLELLLVFVGLIFVTWRYLQVNKPTVKKK